MHIAHCTKFEVVVAFRFFFLADVINNANAFLPGGGLLMCGCSDDFDTIGVVTDFSNKDVVVFHMSHHERLNEKRELRVYSRPSPLLYLDELLRTLKEESALFILLCRAFSSIESYSSYFTYF